MKITDLNIGTSAWIRKVNGNRDLCIHLMELGIVSGTLIKIIRKTDYLITIRYRNIDMVLTCDIGDKIDCSCR